MLENIHPDPLALSNTKTGCISSGLFLTSVVINYKRSIVKFSFIRAADERCNTLTTYMIVRSK